MNVSFRSRIDLRWYLAVRCEKCQVPILFALDRAEGAEERQPPLTEKLVLTCSLESCKHKGNYTTAAVLRFQKPPGAAHKPNKDN
jgi:hypothetical protein